MPPICEDTTPPCGLSPPESVPGWMTEAELLWLAHMARQLKPGDVWIEVGVWKGRSAWSEVQCVEHDAERNACKWYKERRDEKHAE